MIEALIRLLLVAVIALVVILWIVALIDSDGKCHLEDCDGCMYEVICQEEGKRNHEDC